jgi:hypothetical protein
MRTIILLAVILAHGVVNAAEPRKVVCATRTETPPVIDGRLDEACWGNTEVRSDFTLPNGPAPPRQITTMRLVYDDAAVYLGLEYFYDDIGEVESAVRSILEKHGPPGKGPQLFGNVSWTYNMEIFVDPGATRFNYVQIMVNAANQYTGNVMARWDLFEGGHTGKSTVLEDRLVFEFAYPYSGIRAGDKWGFNLVRNDGYAYAIWKRVGAAFHAPRRFGDLLMGSYAEWWEAAWSQGVGQDMDYLKNKAELIKTDSSLEALHASVRGQKKTIDETRRALTALDRPGFEALYAAYLSFNKDLARLLEATRIMELMTQLHSPTERKQNLIRNGGFEEWKWAPIPPRLAKELRLKRLHGFDINIDVRGPAYHRWTGHGCTGHLVEGEEAFKGKSVLVNNDATGADAWTIVIGQHASFGGLLKPETNYDYEIALKGTGTFILRVWVLGINPVTGETKWLGFPDLIAQPVTAEWNVYKGSFRLPVYDDPHFQPKEKVGFALVFESGAKIYFDEFKLVEKTQ